MVRNNIKMYQLYVIQNTNAVLYYKNQNVKQSQNNNKRVTEEYNSNRPLDFKVSFTE